MELDITTLIETFGDEMESFFDSIANSGFQNIGQITWHNAVCAADQVMFVNDENRDKIIAYFLEFGAWNQEELEAHTDAETNALLIQCISGDYQERQNAEDRGELEEYEENQGGHLYKGDNGRWFYYVGM